MKRRIISSLLVLIMAVGIIGNISVGAVEYGVENQNMPAKTYTQKFSDVPPSHWGFSYIGEMVERGVLNGYPDGSYYPENTVTRAEFAKIMTVSAGISIYQPGYQYFDDVAIEEWYAPYIHSAYPFLSGYEYDFGRYYRPDVPALREDIAVALVKLKGYDTLGADESILDVMFTDAESISDNARIYVATAIERGLVSGYQDRTFRGQDSITRAEAATMLWRAYQYGDDNKVFDEEITAPTTAPQSTTVPSSTTKPIKTSAPIEDNDTTEMPKIESSDKNYIIDTIVKANVSNSHLYATDDGEYIYYYDGEDDAIYKINIENSSKIKICTLSSLEYENYETVTKTVVKEVEKTVPKTVEVTEDTEEEAEFDEEVEENSEIENEALEQETENEELNDEESAPYEEYEVVIEEIEEEVTEEELKGTYSDYCLEQIYYNSGNDKVLVKGYFSKYQTVKSNTPKSDEKIIWYEIDGNDLEVYSDLYLKDRNGSSLNRDIVIGNTDNGNVIVSDYYGNMYIYDLENKKLENVIGRDRSCKYIYTEENSFYGLRVNYANMVLCKYNFITQQWEQQWDDFTEYNLYGLKDQIFYLWNIEEGSIYKIASDGNPQKQDIDLINDVEIIDFNNMPSSNVNESVDRLFIINGCYIFYDKDAAAWRVIKER